MSTEKNQKKKTDEGAAQAEGGAPSAANTPDAPPAPEAPPPPAPPVAPAGARRSEPRRTLDVPATDDDHDREPEPPKEEPILRVATGRSIISTKRGVLAPGEIVYPSDLVQSRNDQTWDDRPLREKALRLLRLGACVKL